MLFLLLSISLTVCAIHGQENKDRYRKAMEDPDLFEGDMIIDNPEDRNVIPGKEYRWTDATVPYVLEPPLDGDEYKDMFSKAFKIYESTTCVRFVPRTNEENYVRIYAGKGCSANVGMLGGPQKLSLGQYCYFVGTVLHELGHALGLFHEHSRSDRDDHLDIHLENVLEGHEYNFRKLYPHQNLLLTPFDYDSIMIYGNTAFSKDEESFTMTAKNGQKLLDPFEKDTLTALDIKRVNEMYECEVE